MRVIALIDEPAIVRRILEHLGRWEELPTERGPPARLAAPRGDPPYLPSRARHRVSAPRGRCTGACSSRLLRQGKFPVEIVANGRWAIPKSEGQHPSQLSPSAKTACSRVPTAALA